MPCRLAALLLALRLLLLKGGNSSQDDIQQPETGAALAPATSIDTKKKTQSSSENARSQQNTPQAGEALEAIPTLPNRSSTTSKKPTTPAKEPSATPQGKPGYTDRGTQVSRINDTPTHATYRITFNIAPNQYFGTPMIELVMYHYDVCVNSESSLRKTFRYNGNNSFFVDCVIDKSRPEARLGSDELYASLNLTAQNGEGIVGGIGDYRYYLPSGYSK